MTSGFAIDSEKFGALCEETKKLYFSAESGAPWYNIPPTIHKVLYHGKDLIEHCPLPIGLSSEEPAEANNKVLRQVKLHHSRKTSLLDNMSDIFHRLTDISDPKIVESSLKKRDKISRQRKPLSPEIQALLRVPELPVDNYPLEDEIDLTI